MLSELQAVNIMLSTIGSAPVNTISGTVSADVALAKNILDEVRLDVLLEGWNFNTTTGVQVSPESDGRIPLEDDVLRVDLTDDYYSDANPVQRGGYLYDRKNLSYTWSTGLTLDFIVDLDWDELPQVARRYIAARAARVMAGRLDTESRRVAMAQADELQALANMQRHETDTGDYTIFDSSTARTILRRGL